MGVPLVTMIGKRPASRVGASLMHQIGLPELITNNLGEFVTVATKLAADRKTLSTLRRTMRERLNSSSLRDEADFARAIEETYRIAWQRWCTSEKV